MMNDNALGLVIRDEKVVVSSRDVARVFEKEHRRVTQDVRNLACSEGFAQHNFVRGSYLDANNQSRPEYLMTRDGFTLLAMGYTGSKAMQFKEAYIAAFNRMEAELKNRNAIQVPKTLLEALQLATSLEVKRIKLEEQNAIMAPKAQVYDAHYGQEDVLTPLVKFARTLDGVNVNQIKASLARLGYLYKLNVGGTYRVYSKFRGMDKLFVEKFSSQYEQYAIYLTPKGVEAITQHYYNGELLMKKGWRW